MNKLFAKTDDISKIYSEGIDTDRGIVFVKIYPFVNKVYINLAGKLSVYTFAKAYFTKVEAVEYDWKNGRDTIQEGYLIELVEARKSNEMAYGKDPKAYGSISDLVEYYEEVTELRFTN